MDTSDMYNPSLAQVLAVSQGIDGHSERLGQHLSGSRHWSRNVVNNSEGRVQRRESDARLSSHIAVVFCPGKRRHDDAYEADIVGLICPQADLTPPAAEKPRPMNVLAGQLSSLADRR